MKNDRWHHTRGRAGQAGVAAFVGLVLAASTVGPVAAAGTATGTVQFMQVVAHEDDDLFFMNPELYYNIRNGAASVTVYTTANQLSGAGSTPEQMARSTQKGVENTYARMAGVPDADPNAQEEWTEAAWTIGTRQVERFTLTARPNVQLVFMNLHDGQLGDVYDNGLVDSTVVPTGSPVTQSYRYAKADVKTVLLAIMNAYQPSVLRTQDTLPDSRYTPDHADHFATARFVNDTLSSYANPVTELSYHDYNIDEANRNLTDQAVADKTHFYRDVYAPFDPQSQPFDWLTRQYIRWPRGTQWVGRNGAGNPQAFVVRTGVVSTYWLASDGTWAGPSVLSGTGGPVVPGVSAITNTNGTLQVFARRRTDHHVVTIKQTAANGAWATSWTDLGNPNISLGGDPEQIGVPTVAMNANGSLWVFVKDGGGGLCGRKQTSAGGSWASTWTDLGGGSDVQETAAAIRGNDGRIEIFASTTTGVLRWRQSSANGSILEAGSLPTLPGLRPASPPTVTKNHDGSLEVIYREAGTTNMVTTYQSGVGGGWTAAPVRLGGQGGVGQPALVTAPPGADARIMVFERNDGTGVSMTMQQAPDAPYGSWTDLGGTIVDYPAGTIDATGAVYVFAIGYDGKLYVRRQASAGANSPFNAWQPIG
jgi:LmbE family N-acetylglucosaminyl deacetylase